ncbi:hypothetical protein BGZ93_001175 [Podila epicladia]|nr:hypothetical protein BGZ92_008227 [Podila epicladia]KAG0098085.1 hypothetical protein BGZ93_001175 [Podila epicladia]
MDNDDNHHRPPILLQSDDHDHGSRRSSQHLLTALALHAEESGHVHSQACQDSCPVQDIYTELSYSRFSQGARTNLFGLVVLKELSKSTPPLASLPPSPQFRAYPLSASTGNDPLQDAIKECDQTKLTSEPEEVSADHLEPIEPTPESTESPSAQESAVSPARTKTSIFTSSGTLAFQNLPARYALVAAGSMVKCFLGLEESFELTVCGSANQEIVSMDAFERVDDRGCQLVVTVAIAKAEDQAQFEIRCYGANTFGTSIKELFLGLPCSKDVQTIPVSWAPTKITHAPLDDDPFEMAILVGGSDSCVHFYLQDESSGAYSEKPIESYFSVLSSFPYCEYCVLSLTIKDYPTYRVVAAGTQNGTLNVGIIPRDPVTLKLDRTNAKSHTIVLFAPITTLNFFTSRVQSRNVPVQDSHPTEGIHLLVTCAIEQVWVYSDIITDGLLKRTDLAECSYHDSILAAHVMDADWDGHNELLIGTYGRQLMVFKGLPTGQLPYSNTAYSSSHVSHLHQQHHLHQHHNYSLEKNDHTDPGGNFGMTWNRRFASPVYGIASADLNDDGLEELIITTLNGVSFFIPDPITAKRRLAQAIERMKEIEEMKLTLERLRASNDELFEQQRIREEQELQRLQEEQERQRLQEEERKRLIEEALQRQLQLEEEKEQERRALEEKMEQVEREREEQQREFEQEDSEAQEQLQLEDGTDTQKSEQAGIQEVAVENVIVEQEASYEQTEGRQDQAQPQQNLEAEQPAGDSEPMDDDKDTKPSQDGVEESISVEPPMEPNSVQEEEAKNNMETLEDGRNSKQEADDIGSTVKDEDNVPNKDEHPAISTEPSEPSADIHCHDQEQDRIRSQEDGQVANILSP